MPRGKNSHCRNWKQVSHELNIVNSRAYLRTFIQDQEKDKDFGHKDQDQDKDKDFLHKDKDSALVIKESLRTRTRTNITAT